MVQGFSVAKISRIQATYTYGEDLSFKGWGVADGNELRVVGTGTSTLLSAGGSGMLTMDEGGYTEIPAGSITENTIWDSDVYVLGKVDVNNAMLIIKPGVTVWMSYYGAGRIVVKNNGCLIANGTPDSMIVFRSAAGDVWWEGYPCAIKLEETASSLSEISYCVIADACTGIWSQNKRLDTPIHDNSIWYCYDGIGQDGPMLTDVINNEVINAFEIGIGVNLADTDGGAVTNKNEILIENNTIVGSFDVGMGQEFGIYISGVENLNDAGTVVIANNLIVTSWVSAICQTGGWIRSCVVCNGFYGNGSLYYEGTGGGGSLGEYVHDPCSVTVENFNTTYGETIPHRINDTWKDYFTQSSPRTSAQVYSVSGGGSPDLVLEGNSMRYWYRNDLTPYYSECRADVVNLPSGVGTNWTNRDVNTLRLYFCGQLNNDANEQMYVKLVDGSSVVGKVNCPSMAKIREEWWHVWNIPLAEFNDINLANVKKIAIGFGDGNEPAGDGVVYFDDIRLYSGDSPPMEHTVKVPYNGGAYNLMEEWWHVWNIPLAEFNDINLANVKKIMIGFGDVGGPAGEGTVCLS